MGKLHSGLLNQRRGEAMHVILENESQAINTRKSFLISMLQEQKQVLEYWPKSGESCCRDSLTLA
jgi:hypothetical protein